LGLIGTSIYNIAQISATHEQIETTQWRDLLSSLDKPNPDIAQSLTVPFRLRSFANSKRYSQDARLIGAAVLSKVADFDGFRQLFNFIFADQRANDIETMIEIQGQLSSTFQKLDNSCLEKSQRFEFPKTPAYQSVCWDAYTDKQVQDFGLKIEDSDIWEMRKAYRQLDSELGFMSLQITTALRSSLSKNRGNIKLINPYLLGANFRNLDFSSIDLSGTAIVTTLLTHATLLPIKFDDVSFVQSNWWDATIVDKKLLQRLIDTAFPSKSQHFSPPVTRPTRLEYVSAVLALCHKVDLPCTEAHIPYENDETGVSN